MSERVQLTAEEIRRCLDEAELREWVAHQRWYASKSRSITGIDIVESITLRDDPLLLLALVQTRFATGTHELYQLPLAIHLPGEIPRGESIAHTDGWSVYDALADPEQAHELLRRIIATDEIETEEGHFGFHPFDGDLSALEATAVRLMGVEQSNSSIVFDDKIVLKVFRKLEPGVNPELEVLRFLTYRGFRNISPLYGWYDYDGQALVATLGVAQAFLPDAVGGWELALDQIVSAPERFLEQLGRLGIVTGELHNVLASDASDPAFSPEEPSQEALSLLTATVDEDIERIFVRLPEDERLAPIAGRGQDVRERLAARAQIGMTGRVIRTHGDYRDSTTLVEAVPDGWWYTTPVPGRRRDAAFLTDADLLPPRTARTTRDWSERLALAPHTANALASAGLSLTHAPLLTDASVAYLDPLTGPDRAGPPPATTVFDEPDPTGWMPQPAVCGTIFALIPSAESFAFAPRMPALRSSASETVLSWLRVTANAGELPVAVNTSASTTPVPAAPTVVPASSRGRARRMGPRRRSRREPSSRRIACSSSAANRFRLGGSLSFTFPPWGRTRPGVATRATPVGGRRRAGSPAALLPPRRTAR
jgi:maltokinase